MYTVPGEISVRVRAMTSRTSCSPESTSVTSEDLEHLLFAPLAVYSGVSCFSSTCPVASLAIDPSIVRDSCLSRSSQQRPAIHFPSFLPQLLSFCLFLFLTFSCLPNCSVNRVVEVGVVADPECDRRSALEVSVDVGVKKP